MSVFRGPVHIYLRVREKLWGFLGGLFTLLAGIGLVTAYFSIRAATEKAVDTYVQTDVFKQSVVQTTNEKLAELKQRADAIDRNLAASEKRLATLAKLPISIGTNGVAMIDPHGEKFFIETGTTKEGQTVTFSNSFRNPPAVILNLSGNRFGDLRLTKERSIPYAPNVTRQGFSLPTSIYERTYTWVALGQ